MLGRDRHGPLRVASPLVAAAEHYFTAQPATGSATRSVDLVLPDLRLRLLTDRATFSPDQVDRGTKLLLLDGPRPPEPATAIADVGCGYGPIALALAVRSPRAVVWAVDVNERAVELCRANAAAAGLDNVEAITPDAVPAGLELDAIYSNPPIRIGKAALQELLEVWLARLRPGGRMVLVVHRHLGSDSLQRWLEEGGWPTRRLLSRSGYRLLQTDRGPSPVSAAGRDRPAPD
jgi:16S rRNA (guanine1207-N2)-methyltransferase